MGERIALIGAGAMGGAIGTRLLETGNQLAVFDLDAEKVAALVGKGGVAAPSAAEAAKDADFVITSLNAAHIVEIAAFGAGGITEGARPGTVIIDMSSIAPDATRDLAARAAEKGLMWVDSPLSGGAPKALTGELTLMAGGKAEDVYVPITAVVGIYARENGQGMVFDAEEPADPPDDTPPPSGPQEKRPSLKIVK